MRNSNAREGIQYDVVETPLPDGVEADHDVRIPLRDGISLAASLYRPRSSDAAMPVIVAISPYGKTNFEGIKVFSRVPNNHIGHIRISDSVSFEAADPGFWVPRGYAVLQVDVRGQGASEGDTEPLGPTEQADYQEIIGWAASQPWSTGAVGLLGVSYLAVTQWGVAQHRPPALKAIIPWEGFTDPYLRAYPGGIPEVGMWQFVLKDWLIPNHNPACGIKMPPPGFGPEAHPLRDDYWDAQRIAIEDVDVPVLLCASFSDQGLHSRDSFENFGLISHQRKWMFSHRRPKWDVFYGEEALGWQLDFFNRYLKGDPNAFVDWPRVRYDVHEDREHYTVRTAENWPPQDVTLVPLFLDASNAGAQASPPAVAARVEYAPPEGAAYFDHVFEADTTIVGHAKLKLWVEAVGSDDMDLFAGIQKLDSDGNQIFFYGFGGTNPNDLVSRGWLRVSHRQLDATLSRPDRPVHTHRSEEKLAPGEIVPVEIELLPSATLFRAGETLRVVVQGVAIQPDATLLQFLPCNQGAHRIWAGGKFDTHLLMPVLGERR